MASITQLDLGTVAGDGTGEGLRDGGVKINANFTALNTELLSTTALATGAVQTVNAGELAFLDESELPGTTADFRGTGAETLQAAFAAVAAGAGADADALQGVPLDATVGSPSDGDILVFRALGSDWVLEAKPAGSSPNVNDLGDVTITAVSNNELLAFDIGTGEWVNQTAAEAGLQVLLAAAGVTVRSSGALSFDGGTVGQVWTVDAAGDVSFVDASLHTHELADITDAGDLAGLNTVGTAQIDAGSVTAAKIEDQAGVTPGSYTNADITVTQEGIISAVASGTSGGGLTTATDSNTLLAVGAAANTHKILDSASAITLALDPEATVGTKQAFTPGGAGAVTIEAGSVLQYTTGAFGTGDTPDVGDTVTGDTSGASGVIIAIEIDTGTFAGGDAAGTILIGAITSGPFQAENLSFTDGETAAIAAAEDTAGYWLPGDNTTGSARTTSFGLTGYGYFECFRNTGGSAAEWAFVGESDHNDLADNDLDFNNNTITNAVMGSGWVVPEVLMIAASDESTDLTTGTAKVTFRMPFAMTLTGVRANVNTAPTGAALIVDINEGGVSVLSTKITIDVSEESSETAATPAVISDSALADDAEMTIDIDQIGSTIAGKGLKVALIGTRTLA